MGNRHKNFDEDWMCSSEDMIVDKQTHTHTHRQTDTLITILRLPIWWRSNETSATTASHAHTHTDRQTTRTHNVSTGPICRTNARFMTHVTCRLTAKNRDQLRNTTRGNQVWATFSF